MKYLKIYVLLCFCLLAGMASQAQSAARLNPGLKQGAKVSGKNMAPPKSTDGKLSKTASPGNKQTKNTTRVSGNQASIANGSKSATPTTSLTVVTTNKQVFVPNRTPKTSTLQTGKKQSSGQINQTTLTH
jgi:hypothetical protein